MIFKVEINQMGEFWRHNGKFHRDGDNPAITWADGSKFYFKHGERHRDGDKPAVIHANGKMEYWKNGTQYTPSPSRSIPKTIKRGSDYRPDLF